MGASYREFLHAQAKKAGKKRPATPERKEAIARAAVRAEHFRKSRIRHRSQAEAFKAGQRRLM